MATNVPPPPLSLSVVHVDTLAAALTKLGIQVSAIKVLEAIRDEEIRRHTVATSDTPKRATMLELVSEAPKAPSGPSSLSYTSTFIERLPMSTDPRSEERRCRLVDMAKETFPAGQKPPEPYTATVKQCTVPSVEDIATSRPWF